MGLNKSLERPLRGADTAYRRDVVVPVAGIAGGICPLDVGRGAVHVHDVGGHEGPGGGRRR